MRNVTGGARTVNNVLETVNAAATVIASSENRVLRPSVQKKRWGSCWRTYWCFGCHRNRKRINHAVLVPESATTRTEAPAAENQIQVRTMVLPFIAPPSSPASFLQSEPASVLQSPAGAGFLTSVSSNMYSPGGPASIFAIGPYAHETQLVSPPVFSTFTTEPSTAPFTPPPESVHLTTPSSPEVPFAKMLDTHRQNGGTFLSFPVSHFDFQSYQLHPGSPIGQLISPSSGISPSGNSPPFPERECPGSGSNIVAFQRGEPPKLLNLDKLATYEWGSRQTSGSVTPDAFRTESQDVLANQWISRITMHQLAENGCNNGNVAVDPRVSFEIRMDGPLKPVENKPAQFSEVVSTVESDATQSKVEMNSNDLARGADCHTAETCNENSQANRLDEESSHYQKRRSITLESIKEFNFDYANGEDSQRPNVDCEWWANEKGLERKDSPAEIWSFIPVTQPS